MVEPTMVCPHCHGTEFRLSSLRLRDLEHLAVLRYPVRRGLCHHRTHGSLLLALAVCQTRRHAFSGGE